MYARLLEIAKEYGTPVYVYNAQQIRSNLRQLRGVFGTDVNIHFACKALSNPHILKLLQGLGCGIDAVSQGELQLGLASGFEPGRINFTPSGAPFGRINLGSGSWMDVHVDNLEILDLLGALDRGMEISLRFNPGVRVGGHVHLQVGASDSKFGIYPEELPELERIIEKHSIEVIGVHVHVGSDVTTTSEFLEAWRLSFDMAWRFRSTVRIVDLGGGYKAADSNVKQAIDLEALNDGVRKMKEQFEEVLGRK